MAGTAPIAMIASGSAALAALLGATVMGAWVLGLRAVVQLSPNLAPIQFNTALCLLLSGSSLLLGDHGYRIGSLIGSTAVAFIAGATAVEYLFTINLGIDQLVVDASFGVARTLTPGRMSPQTVTALLGIAAILIATNFISVATASAVRGVGGFVVGGIAMTALIGNATGINQTTGWLSFTRVSPQTGFGLLMIATSLVARAWRDRSEPSVPRWIMSATVVGSLLVGVLIFLGVNRLEPGGSTSILPEVTLALFVALGAAFGAVMAQHAKATAATRDAVAAKSRIESLLAHLVQAELVAKLALENTHQGVWDLNVASGVTTVDDGFRKIIGREPLVNPIQDETWRSVVHPDDAATVRAALRATLEGEENLYEANFRVKTAVGGWLWVNSRGRVVERGPDGRALRMVGTLRDITEQQQSREALERATESLRQARKLEAVGRLAGGIAHHINNHMTVVIGRSDLLRRAPGADQQASLHAINSAAEDTAALCRQLLAYGRRQFLQPASFDLNELVRETANVLGGTLAPRLRLVLALKAAPSRCFADARQIEWVIEQLLANARDAMPRQGIVRVETANLTVPTASPLLQVPPGRYVMVTVSDQGAGIEPSVLDRLFEPFLTTKDVGQGQGLSLAACYGIVKQSRGDITVRSEPGRGTAVTFCLPEG